MVIGILGPTGVGKTAVGMELASRLGVRVMSCDSLQIYRGMPVLTNQPSVAELAAVRHEMVAVADPTEEWSAARYAASVRPLVDADLARAGHALLVGGTGLYMRAAVGPLAAPPPTPHALQAELEARAKRDGPEALHRELAALDPQAASSIHPRNVRRVVRALGAVLTKPGGAPRGETGGRWSGRSDLWAPHYHHPTVLIGLTLPRDVLYRRINMRARAMLDDGAVQEVADVLAAYAGVDDGRALERGVGKAIGFRLIAGHLAGRWGLEEVEERLATATRAYARRQLTWMRKVPGIVIMDVSEKDPATVAADIMAGI